MRNSRYCNIVVVAPGLAESSGCFNWMFICPLRSEYFHCDYSGLNAVALKSKEFACCRFAERYMPSVYSEFGVFVDNFSFSCSLSWLFCLNVLFSVNSAHYYYYDPLANSFFCGWIWTQTNDGGFWWNAVTTMRLISHMPGFMFYFSISTLFKTIIPFFCVWRLCSNGVW